MDFTQAKKDRVMSSIFGQLEMLQELAIEAGDATLAQDLSAAFANALTRYCDQKHLALSATIDHDLRTRQAG